jgi:hypothetical protein
MPVVHGGSKQDVTDAVAICVAAGGNCSLSLDWSPYIGESEREGGRVDPRRCAKNRPFSCSFLMIHFVMIIRPTPDRIRKN